MGKKILRYFSYLSAMIGFAVLIGVLVLALGGNLTSERLQQASLALRGELSETTESGEGEDADANRSELEINDTLLQSVKEHEKEKRRWLDRMMQEKALAEVVIEVARRERETLAHQAKITKSETDRKVKVIADYNEQVVDKTIKETVETWKNMKPKALVKMVAGMEDKEIARRLAYTEPEFRAKVFKELTEQLGSQRATSISRAIEKQLQKVET